MFRGYRRSEVAVTMAICSKDLANCRCLHHSVEGSKGQEGRGCTHTLYVADGNRDRDAVYSAIREWLVPLLAHEFLADRRSGRSENTVTSPNSSSEPLSEKGAANPIELHGNDQRDG